MEKEIVVNWKKRIIKFILICCALPCIYILLLGIEFVFQIEGQWGNSLQKRYDMIFIGEEKLVEWHNDKDKMYLWVEGIEDYIQYMKAQKDLVIESVSKKEGNTTRNRKKKEVPAVAVYKIEMSSVDKFTIAFYQEKGKEGYVACYSEY